MSHLNIAFDRYASIGTIMHYILVISKPYWAMNIVPRFYKLSITSLALYHLNYTAAAFFTTYLTKPLKGWGHPVSLLPKCNALRCLV